MWEFLTGLSVLFSASGLPGLVIFGLFLLVAVLIFFQLKENKLQTAELRLLNVGNAKIESKVAEIETNVIYQGRLLSKIDVRTQMCITKNK